MNYFRQIGDRTRISFVRHCDLEVMIDIFSESPKLFEMALLEAATDTKSPLRGVFLELIQYNLKNFLLNVFRAGEDSQNLQKLKVIEQVAKNFAKSGDSWAAEFMVLCACVRPPCFDADHGLLLRNFTQFVATNASNSAIESALKKFFRDNGRLPLDMRVALNGALPRDSFERLVRVLQAQKTGK
jgi:hypothetical protein